MIDHVLSYLEDYTPGEGDVDLPPARVKPERMRPISVVRRTMPITEHRPVVIPQRPDKSREIPVTPVLPQPPRIVRNVRPVNRVMVQRVIP